MSSYSAPVQQAQYTSNVSPNYRGNPFIEALPEPLSEADFYKALARTLAYSESDRKLPEHQRRGLISDINRFFQPLPRHYELYLAIDTTLRSSYYTRNPVKRDYFPSVYQRIAANSPGQAIPNAPLSSSLIGISGIGKSVSLENILRLFPELIYHSQYGDRRLDISQVVWLKLNCPYDGSTKTLAYNFFSALDQTLQGNISMQYINKRQSASQLLFHMRRLCSLNHIGVLVIDEIQNLNKGHSGGNDEMMRFFTELATTLGIPVILVGTYAAASVLSDSFSTARRYSSQGQFVWNPLTKSDEWDLFVKYLWRYQYTANPTVLTADASDALYECSYGILDIAVKVYQQAQYQALSLDGELITPNLIREVAQTRLPLIQQMLAALKDYQQTGSARMLRPIEDLYNPLIATPVSGNTSYSSKEPPDQPSRKVSGTPGKPIRKVSGAPSKPIPIGLLSITPDSDIHQKLASANFLGDLGEFVSDS